MKDDFELHPSRLATWGACEAKAMAEYLVPKGAQRGRPSINTWIGTAVHAGVAGQLLPEEPKFVQYNTASPNFKTAMRQAHRMIEAVGNLLDAEQWDNIKEHEVETFGTVNDVDISGTIDLIVQDALGEMVVIDLKTGDLPPFGAWVQLACYRHVHEMHHPDLTYSDDIAVISVPRTKLGQDQEPARVEKRNYRQVWDAAASAWILRIKQLKFYPERTQPTRSPGWHCKSCVAAEHCPVAAS